MTIALAAGYGAWRLTNDTLPLTPFIPTVERALTRLVGDPVHVETLRLGYDQERQDFLVIAQKVQAISETRDVPLDLGDMNVTLDPVSLLRGKARIKRASVSGMEAALVRDGQGRAAFGFGPAAAVAKLPRRPADPAALRNGLQAARQALAGDGPGSRVQSLDLEKARFVLMDVETGARLTVADARAALTRDEDGGLRVEGFGVLLETGGGVSFTLTAPDDLSDINAEVAIDRLKPSGVRVRGVPAALRALDAPVTANGFVRLDAAGGPVAGELLAVLAPGAWNDVTIAGARGQVAWTRLGATAGQGRVPAGATDLVIASADTSVGRLVDARVRARPVRDGGQSIDFTARTITGLLGAGGQGELTGVTGRGVLARNGLPLSLNASARTAKATMPDATPFLSTLSLDGSTATLEAVARRDGLPVAWSVSLTGPRGAIAGPAGQASVTGVSATAADLTRAGRVSALRLSVQGANGRDRTGRPVESGPLKAAITRASPAAPWAVSLDAARFSAGLGNGAAVRGQGVTLAARDQPGGWRIEGLKAALLGGAARGVDVAVRDLALSGLLAGQGAATALEGADIAAKDVRIASERWLTRPMNLRDVRLSGAVSARTLEARAFSFAHARMAARGRTDIRRAPRGSPRVTLDAAITGPVSFDELMAAWPLNFLRETRRTLDDLVLAAEARTDSITLDIPAGVMRGQGVPDGAIGLDFTFVDGAVRYLRGMSPLTGLAGRASLRGNSMDIAVDEGRLGGIALSEGRVDLPRFNPRGALATFSLRATGDATEMAHEIDRAPLRLLSKAGVEPDRIAGRGVVDITVTRPMQRVVADADVGVTAKGDFEGVSFARVLGDMAALDGKVKLEADRRRVSLEGRAHVGGAPFDFLWAAGEHDEPGPPVRLIADGIMTAADIGAFGVDVSDWVGGRVRLGVRASSQSAQIDAAVVSVDLRDAVLTAPGGLWTKEAGRPGSVTARLFPREGGGWTVSDLRGDAPGALARGGLEFGEGLRFETASFGRIAVDNVADVSAQVRRDATGEAFEVDVSGPFANLSPFLSKRDVTVQANQFFDTPMTLNVDIARLRTGVDDELDEVTATLMVGKAGWSGFDLAARSEGGLMNTVALRQEPDGARSISGHLSDAGLFARLLYPSAPVDGGRATIEGALPVAGTRGEGRLSVKARDVRLDRGGGAPVTFDVIDLPMLVRGDVVSLTDGRAEGAAYNVKASGYVDLGAGRVSLAGVATPGGLNRALGGVPILGPLLAGREDEGLVGVTFSVRGDLQSPAVRANPLSALAPGVFRRLFEGRAPVAPPLPPEPVEIVPPARLIIEAKGPEED